MNEDLISSLEFRELTTEVWPCFVRLFGDNGACGGCWCMTWRLRNKAYLALKGLGNKNEIHKLVKKNSSLGIIAFLNDDPIGWCSVSPREQLPRLETSRILRPVDDEGVWSIVCLFILKPYRRKGLSYALISAASTFAAENGARIIEAYPVSTTSKKLPDPFAFTGTVTAYLKAGFHEVARRSPTRPIMRKEV